MTLINVFDIDLQFRLSSNNGANYGSDANELLAGVNDVNNRLEGYGGYDYILGGNKADIINSGSGEGFIFAGEGADQIYIDHTSNGDQITIDLADADNAVDTVFFGNDYNVYGRDTLGQTFVTVNNFGGEDRIVLRDMIGENDFHFVIDTGDDLLLRIRHGDHLSQIRFTNVDSINILEI